MRHWLEEHFLLSLGWLLRHLPRWVGLQMGRGLGLLIYWTGIRRQVTQQNLKIAFPEWSSAQIYQTARRCYQHFGTLVTDLARLPLLSGANVGQIVDLEGREVLEATLSAGRGGILVSGHFGNWEMMGATAAVLGYPLSFLVMGQENERVTQMMERLRQGTGAQIIQRRAAAKGVLKALKNNRIVAILADQDAHEAGVFVPFFGRLSSTPRGAATFTLRSGARLIFGESFRLDSGKIKVIFQFISTDNLSAERDAAVRELTRRFTYQLETAIRRHPEQWFWMHRRWKTPPPAQKLTP